MNIAESQEVTLEQLLASDDRGRFEIVDGQLVEVNVSNLSVDVGAQFFGHLFMQTQGKSIGRVFGADAYYQCFPEGTRKARKPDVSFISQPRFPKDWREQSVFTIPPDLAVEVTSPNDLAYEVDQKISEYLSVGVRLVWIVNPVERLVMIYRLDGTVQRLHDNETLSGEDVVPGFACKVSDFIPLTSE